MTREKFDSNQLVFMLVVFVFTSMLAWLTYTTNQNQIGFAKIEQRLISEQEKARIHNQRISDTLQIVAEQLQTLSNRLEKSNDRHFLASEGEQLEQRVHDLEITIYKNN
ncbi:hypothetical protein JK628_02925 [Shewanella sp. KX20019]|uniref:hypothetical protein n=1 Tax=Shewanella sp. KX20019 TaxID=2803864 RepID=UPI0019277420|nr:hypothetical protein [Shewanella sp. KX20019]QQX80843.1 hypothetical protein JK628_02925 [Shewanella sp. KX20019]